MNFWCQIDPGFNPSDALKSPDKLYKPEPVVSSVKQGNTYSSQSYPTVEYVNNVYRAPNIRLGSILWFTVLCLITLRRYCMFVWKVCGNPASSKSIGGIFFPTASAHFVSLSHLLVILTVFPTFSLYLLW